MTFSAAGRYEIRALFFGQVIEFSGNCRMSGIAPTDIEMVEVLEFKVAGVPVTPGKPFLAGEDWLKDLTVRVKNISAKPISYLSMNFALPEAKYVKDGREYKMGYSLEYKEGSQAKEGAEEMKVVKPGEEVELVYFEQSYLSFKQQVAKKTGIMSISSLQSGGDMRVHFTDGSIWIGSNLSIRSQTGRSY